MIIEVQKNLWIDLMPSSTTYASGDVVGTIGGPGVDGGKIPLLGLLESPYDTAILRSITIVDYTTPAQKAPFSFCFYKNRPNGEYGDNDAWPGISDEGFSSTNSNKNVFGVVSVANTDYYLNNIATKTGINLPMSVLVTDGKIPLFYVVAVIGASATYSQPLYVNFGFTVYKNV